MWRLPKYWPPTPSPPGECVCTPPLVRGEDTLAGWRGGWGVNILEDARHCSVLYIRKYFVVKSIFALFSNQITKLSDSYNLPFRSTLGTFFLGENHLTSIPSDFFRKEIRQNITWFHSCFLIGRSDILRDSVGGPFQVNFKLLSVYYW